MKATFQIAIILWVSTQVSYYINMQYAYHLSYIVKTMPAWVYRSLSANIRYANINL